MSRRRSRPRVRVLEAVKPPDGTTRYIDQVVAYPDRDITFRFISVRELLFGRHDVVHFHWPEMILRDRRRWVEFVKSFIFDFWVVTLKLRKVGIVRTLHNLTPHDGASPRVLRSLARLDKRTDLFVSINPTTQAPGPSVYIPHGHYRDRFSRSTKMPEKGRVLYAGLIRPYKGIDRLLHAFANIEDPALSLRIVGKPTSPLRSLIKEAIAHDPARVSARLEFVPDQDLVDEFGAAELVCLPYRDLHNSGILLVALSLDRPVLVPDTDATRALAEEVGDDWLIRFSGELDASTLESAVRAAQVDRASTRPRLEQREWTRVGQSYSEAFRRAADLAERRRLLSSRRRPTGLR